MTTDRTPTQRRTTTRAEAMFIKQQRGKLYVSKLATDYIAALDELERVYAVLEFYSLDDTYLQTANSQTEMIPIQADYYGELARRALAARDEAEVG